MRTMPEKAQKEIEKDSEHTLGSKPKIMLVDDNERVLELIKRNLESIRDYKIDIESDPEKALEKIDPSYDCIVSDYDMPKIDGLRLLDRIKRSQKISFIMHSGKGNNKISSEAISRGADNYIRKSDGEEHFKALADKIDKNISKN